VTDDHLSTDELAELDEGLLAPEAADAARAHLDGCDECRARLVAIAAIRTTLGALPPVTMPDDVVARLDAALAGAAAAQPPTPAVEPPSGSETVMPNVIDLPKRQNAFGRLTWAGGAVAATLVLLVGAIVIGHSRNHGSSAGSSGAGGTSALAPKSDSIGSVVGPNVSSTFTTSSTGHTYTAANLPTLIPSLVAPAFAAATPQTHGTPEPSAASSANSTLSTRSTAPSSATATGTTASGGQATAPEPGRLPEVATPKALLPIARSRSLLLACAASLTGNGAVPEAIDFALWTDPPRYHKTPSIIMVFNGIHPSTVTVYVVSPTCSGNDPVRTFQEVRLSS
jgi:hypothetical protein